MCWRWRRHMPRSSETVARSDRWRSSAPWRSRAAPGSCPRLRRMDRFDHHAGARLRRMDRFGLARLSDRRDCQSPAYGRRPDLCSPLRPVHARWLAGEDDLDAPDLCDGPRSQTSLADEHPLMPTDGQPRVPPRKPGNGQRRNSMHGERLGPLEPEQSAALREKLLTELRTVTSADLAAIWAQERWSPRTASRQPMPSLWRTPLNTGYPSSHRPKARKPQTTLLQALMLISLA